MIQHPELPISLFSMDDIPPLVLPKPILTEVTVDRYHTPQDNSNQLRQNIMISYFWTGIDAWKKSSSIISPAIVRSTLYIPTHQSLPRTNYLQTCLTRKKLYNTLVNQSERVGDSLSLKSLITIFLRCAGYKPSFNDLTCILDAHYRRYNTLLPNHLRMTITTETTLTPPLTRPPRLALFYRRHISASY